MTLGIKLIALLYTAASLCANAAFAQDADIRALIPAELVNFQLHDTPMPPVTTPFLNADEAPITMDAYAGKTVVLNFWATWCAPCRAEMPSLNQLQTELNADEFAVVTVATGRNPPAMIDVFFDRENITDLPKHRDPTTEFGTAYGVTGLPVTVILNPQGQEIARLTGEADWANPEVITLVRAIGEKAAN